MHFRVLGPVQAQTDEGVAIPLGGSKQRTVLALLLVDADRTVPTDSLVEELWPDALTDASRKTAQAYVSRLRRRFAEHGAEDVIAARPTGYVLKLAGHRLDAREAGEALARASAIIDVEPGDAARQLADALRLWRGRPFEDAYPTAGLELEAGRLEEERLAMLETWVEAELAAGRHREVLPTVRRVAADYPLQERLWGLLLLALYRSGRQSEALEAYVVLARRLADELGVEPGPELAELQRQMLAQDPALELPKTARAAASFVRWRRSRRPFLVAAGIVAALALALVAVTLLAPEPVEPVAKLGSRHALPNGAAQIVGAGDRVWILIRSDPAVTAFDVRDDSLTRYELPSAPSAIAAGLGFVWVASPEPGWIMRVDPDTGEYRTTTSGLDLGGAALAVGQDAVWVIREHPRPFLRIDPVELRVETLSFVDAFGGPSKPDLTVEGPTVWASNAFIGRVMSLDPGSGSFDFAGDPRVAEHAARTILADRGAVWFSQPTNGTVTRIDPASGAVTAVARLTSGAGAGFGRIVSPYALAAGPGGLWAALPDDRRVVVMADESAEVLADLTFGRPVSIAATVGRMWVLDERAGQLVEVLSGSCTPVRFIGPQADLRGCDLVGKVLVGVDLTGADLRWANLRQAAIQRADLTGADLLGADLRGSALDDVIWGGTRCPDGSSSDRSGGACSAHSD